MATSLGELFLELGLDTETFDRQMGDIKSKVQTYGRTLEAELKLCPTVDHKPLKALNEHIDLKKRHFDNVNRHFSRNPLKVKVDFSELDRLDKRLREHEKQRRSTTVRPSTTSSESTAREAERSGEVIGDRVGKSVSKAIRKSMGKNPIMGILGSLGNISGAVIENTIGSVFRGALEGVGRDLSQDLSRGLADGIKRESSFIIGSFDFLGREAGAGFVKAIVDALGRDADMIEKIMTDIFGKSAIATEGAAVRGRQRQERSQTKIIAREQAEVEFDFVKQNMPEIKKRGAKLQRQRAFIQAEGEKLVQQIREFEDKIGVTSVRDQLKEAQLGISKITNRLSKSQKRMSPVYGDKLESQADKLMAQAEQFRAVLEEDPWMEDSLQEEVQARIKTLEDRAKKLRGFQQSLSSDRGREAIQSDVNKLGPQFEKAKQKYESIQAVLMSMEKDVKRKFQSASDRIQVFDEKTLRQEREFGNIVGAVDRAEMIRPPDAEPLKKVVAQTTAQAQKRKKKNTGKFANVEDAYDLIFEEVLKASGIKDFDPAKRPKLAVNQKLPQGAFGRYLSDLNKLEISPDLIKKLNDVAGGKETEKAIEGIIHELRHAVQLGFGDIDPSKTTQAAIDLIKPKPSESRRLGSRIEFSTEQGGSLVNKDFTRDLEADAYTFTDRVYEKIFKKVSKLQKQRMVESKIGVGGGKAENKLLATQAKVVNFIESSLEVFKTPLGDEVEQAAREIEAVNAEFMAKLDQLEDIDLIPLDEIGAFVEDIERSLEDSVNELESIKASFVEAAKARRVTIKDQLKDQLGTLNYKKELVPLAKQMGVDPTGMRKKDVIAQLTGQGDLRELFDRANAITREKAKRRLARQEAFQGAAFKAGALARTTGGAIQATVDFVAPVAAPMLNAGGEAVKALGAVAKASYQLASGVESIALDLIPMGRTLKGVTQQTVLPAAMFMGATALLPGGGAIAHGVTDLATTALNPVAGGIAGQLTGAATGALSGLPEMFGIQAAVTGGITAAIDGVVTGAAGALAPALGAIAGGKVIQTALNLPVKAAQQAELLPALPGSTPKALPGAKMKALPSADKALVKAQKQAQMDADKQMALDVAQRTGEVAKGIVDGATSMIATASEAVDRAEKISKGFWNAYKGLQKAIESGDITKAQTLLETIRGNGERAQKEIKMLTGSLGDQAKMGSKVGSQLNNRRSQISRAVNRAEAQVRKMKPADIPTDAIDVDSQLLAIEDVYKTLSEIKENISGELFGFGDIQEALKGILNRAKTGTGSNANDEFNALDIEEELNNLKSNISKGVAGNQATSNADEAIVKAQAAIAKIETILAQLNVAETLIQNQESNQATQHAQQMAGLEKPSETITDRIKRVIASNKPLESLRRQIDEVKERFQGFFDLLGGIGLGFVGFKALTMIGPILSGLVTGGLEVAKQFEQLERIFTFAYGSMNEGAEAMARVRSESKLLGIDMKSALQGQAQLAASTRGTALEGFTTEALGSAARQTTAVMGLAPEQAERVQLAIQQMASKGKISAEELRQQLGEALPGAFQIAARALGVTTQELDKMLERGEVISEDFLPKFATQLSAETSSGVAGALGSTQASINRFNNSVLELQESLGKPLQPVQKMGLNAFAGGLDILRQSMPLVLTMIGALGVGVVQTAVGLLKGTKAATIFTAGINASKSAIVATGKAMVSTQFLVAAGLALAMMAFFKFKESYLDVGKEQRDFAESAQKGMQDYQKSIANARDELKKLGKDAPPELQNLAPPEAPKNTALETLRGFEESIPLLGTSARSQRESIDRLQELGQESVDRRQNDANQQAITGGIGSGSALEAMNQLLGAYRGVQGSGMTNPDSTIGRIQDLQSQIEAAQTRRRALQPGDREGRRTIDLEIEALQREMAPLRNVIAGVQGNAAANIEFFENERKKALREGDGELAARYQSAIDRLTGASDELNGYLQDSINVVGKLNKEFATIQGTMERANRAIEQSTNANRRSIAQGVIGGASQGVADFARFQNEQDNLSQRATTAQTAFQAMQDKILGNTEMMEALNAVGITEFDQIEPTMLRTEAPRFGDSRDRELIEMAADQAEKALSLRSEADNLATQAVEGRAQFVQSIRNLAKQINDFFVNVANQAKEAQIQAQAIAVQTNTQRAQSKLRQSLIGFQDSFINEFADALVQLVEQLNKPLQDAIGAQSQILQVQQQYFSQLQQAFQMGQQLPGLGQVAGTFGPLPGETMQGVPMPAMDNPYGESGVQRPNGEMMGTPATLSTPGASLNPMNPAVNPQAFMQGLQGLEQVNPLQATAFGMGGLQNAGQLITQNYEQQIANIQQQLINSQELAAIEAEVTADRANRALFDATRRINDTARQYNRSIEDLLTSGMDKTAFGQLGNGLRQLDRSLEDSIIGMTDFRRQLTATVDQSAMLYQQITEGIASGLLPDTFRDFLPGLERMAADAQSQLANVDRQITQFQEAAQEARRRQIEGFVRDQRKELGTALAENARLSGRGDEGRLIEYGMRIEQQKEELRLQRIELENLRSSGQITNDEFVMMAQNMEDLNAIKMDNIRKELKRTQRDVEFSSRRIQQQLTIDVTRARQRSAELANDMSSNLLRDAEAQAMELGEAYATRMNDLRSQLESGAIDFDQFNSMANALKQLNEVKLDNLKKEFEKLKNTEFFQALTNTNQTDRKAVRENMQAAINNLEDLHASGIISREQQRFAQQQITQGGNVLMQGDASALRQISDRRGDQSFMAVIQALGGGGLINLMNTAEAMFTSTDRAIDQGFESGQREADAIRNSATFDSVPDNVARIAMKMDTLIAAVQSIGSPDSQLSQSRPAQSPMLSSTADLELAIANL